MSTCAFGSHPMSAMDKAVTCLIREIAGTGVVQVDEMERESLTWDLGRLDKCGTRPGDPSGVQKLLALCPSNYTAL